MDALSSCAPAPQPAAAVLPRLGLPPQVTDLTGEPAFRRLAERRAARCRIDGVALSALQLQLQPGDGDDNACLPDGDWLLECTRRLRARVRGSDAVSRWERQHHGVLLFGCRAVQADAVLQRLLQALDMPYALDGRRLHLRWQGTVLALAAA